MSKQLKQSRFALYVIILLLSFVDWFVLNCRCSYLHQCGNYFVTVNIITCHVFIAHICQKHLSDILSRPTAIWGLYAMEVFF